jgi:hypothetical protein
VPHLRFGGGNSLARPVGMPFGEGFVECWQYEIAEVGNHWKEFFTDCRGCFSEVQCEGDMSLCIYCQENLAKAQ